MRLSYLLILAVNTISTHTFFSFLYLYLADERSSFDPLYVFYHSSEDQEIQFEIKFFSPRRKGERERGRVIS